MYSSGSVATITNQRTNSDFKRLRIRLQEYNIILNTMYLQDRSLQTSLYREIIKIGK